MFNWTAKEDINIEKIFYTAGSYKSLSNYKPWHNQLQYKLSSDQFASPGTNVLTWLFSGSSVSVRVAFPHCQVIIISIHPWIRQAAHIGCPHLPSIASALIYFWMMSWCGKYSAWQTFSLFLCISWQGKQKKTPTNQGTASEIGEGLAVRFCPSSLNFSLILSYHRMNNML